LRKNIRLAAHHFRSGDNGAAGLSELQTEQLILWGAMNDDGIRQQIELLKIEHRDLDDAIAALQASPVADQLQIARMKRKKLAIKDRISILEDQLIPDIIA
jgi:hypothetical protein